MLAPAWLGLPASSKMGGFWGCPAITGCSEPPARPLGRWDKDGTALKFDLWHFREGTEKLWAHLAQARLGGYKGVWTEAYPGTYRKKAIWR